MVHLHSHHRFLSIVLLLGVSLNLAACQGHLPPGPLPAALVAATGSDPGSDPGSASPAQPAAADPVATDAPATDVAPATDGAPATDTATVTGTASSIPVRLNIPDLNLDADVTPMGWEPAMDGERVTTRWVVPLDSLGWAVNSAEAGAAGNVLIIGHQALGSGPLRALALGDIAAGQEIRLVDAGGVTHLYQVSEVSSPIAAIGATAEDMAQAAAYLVPTGAARLTIVTGWPADTTTHRLFVVADYVGTAP